MTGLEAALRAVRAFRDEDPEGWRELLAIEAVEVDELPPELRAAVRRFFRQALAWS